MLSQTLTILVALFSFCLAENEVVPGITTLRLVHMLYRHGDRTPVRPYPNDPYKDVRSWPVSWGQLTNEGKDRQLRLGRFNRKRYGKFLSEMYHPEEVYIRSTDVDRTLMSAEVHLAGLYPPKGNQTWNPDLHWQPIPIHTIQKDDDLLLMIESNCTRYDELLDELNSSPEIQNKMKEHKDMLDFISRHSGLEIKTIDDVENIYDTLFIEARFNKSLPKWTNEYFPERMKELSDFSFSMKAYTNEMQRLRGGPWISELVSNLRNFTNSTHNPRKLYMYSGHDVSVATVLSALKVFNGIQPPYASMILIELHELKPKEYSIQVLYRNVTDDGQEPFVLTLPGCMDVCPLDQFYQLVKNVTAEDIRVECRLLPPPPAPVLNSILVISMLASSTGLLLVALLVILVIFWYRRDNNGHSYSSINIQAE